jgi:hypothetical protein
MSVEAWLQAVRTGSASRESPGHMGAAVLLLRYCGVAGRRRRRGRRGALVPQPWVRLEVATVRHTAAAAATAGSRGVCW